MIQIAIDGATREKLAGLVEPAQLCDECGRVLGVFSPAVGDSLYEGVDSPLTDEELQRREREAETFSTAEVIERLKEL